MLQLYNYVKKISGSIVAKYFHHNTDVYIISHPRSGRTWLRLLLGKILCEKYGFSDKYMLDIYKLTTLAGILRTQLIHDHISYTESYKYFYLPEDKKIYANKKVIFLVRDIKDVLVSYYYYVLKRDREFEGSISNFIRTEKYGVKKIVNFYNSWYESRNIPLEFMVLRYEDMMNNPEANLIKTINFLGLENIDVYTIKKAIEFAKFDNLKKLEREQYFNKKAMRPANKSDDESYTIRRGKVGGYVEYLNQDDIKYIESVIQEIGCPFNQNRKQ